MSGGPYWTRLHLPAWGIAEALALARKSTPRAHADSDLVIHVLELTDGTKYLPARNKQEGRVYADEAVYGEGIAGDIMPLVRALSCKSSTPSSQL